MYDGLLFGSSITGVCYLIDFLLFTNSYTMVAKPLIATVIYMYLYQTMYLTKYAGYNSNKNQS